VNVVRAVGVGRLEHRAEHPVRARERAHRRHQLVAHARDQKAPEATRSVRDPEGCVARADKLAGGVDEPLQDLVDG
jgi:hypothetical protein